MSVALVDLRSDAVVEEVRRACEEIGFLIVTGHDVGPALVEEVDTLSRAFFDLPLEEKIQFCDGDLQRDRPIYRPVKSESLGATAGASSPADLKESLDFGPTLPGVGWPTQPEGIERAYRAYLAAMNELGARLREIFARALGNDDGFFEPLFDDRASSLRVINYPELDAKPDEGQLRAGAHRDYGFVTILRSENVAGGLEVQTRDGDWLEVEAPPHAFVVNLGDMLAEWTGGRWVSTLHRVATPPPGTGTRRQSLVFFHNPREDAFIEAIDATAGDYIIAKAAQAFGT